MKEQMVVKEERPSVFWFVDAMKVVECGGVRIQALTFQFR
jgi:hypothetical protein